MSSTFDTVAEFISEICDIPREKIKPESHVTEDLNVDSLDFLDVVFNIEQKFGIGIPLDGWTQKVNDGEVKGSRYFVLENFCAEVDKIIASASSESAA
ncbi:MAG: acyl carrier protein [Hyphomicrobiaceae bacterium]